MSKKVIIFTHEALSEYYKLFNPDQKKTLMDSVIFLQDTFRDDTWNEFISYLFELLKSESKNKCIIFLSYKKWENYVYYCVGKLSNNNVLHCKKSEMDLFDKILMDLNIKLEMNKMKKYTSIDNLPFQFHKTVDVIEIITILNKNKY